MDEDGTWMPSPAYDLTFSRGPGGEHTMLVSGEGRAPGVEHLAARAELKNRAKIIDQVRTAIRRFQRFADEAGVPARLRDRTAQVLARPAR